MRALVLDTLTVIGIFGLTYLSILVDFACH